ncbi:hypothetical protein FGU71_05115 [Erythrobacter insulae]|uniref:Uncharacterized protein n=1 Tax=Erythrobacter insulae TaxID=2584124 RepID=A0A547PAY9_9SPHN|nr:hypothetical protein [Erythrobacter insulae]TRD11287.1 hypothetical protein FGU71_05115 [Erythrobacter insulae]
MRKSSEQAKRPLGSLAQRWEALHEQAAELAGLAQLAPEALSSDRDSFASVLGNSDEWQRELAWQSIEDIDAMMRPGLTALKVITSRGMDAGAPAQALWREFHSAREGVIRMLQTERRAQPRT